MSTREKIVELVRQNPEITSVELRKVTGVSRQRVFQILDSEGLVSAPAKIYTGVCCSRCNKRLGSYVIRGTCNPCNRILRPSITLRCEICEVNFTIPDYEVKSGSRIGRFCSNKCQGRWFGKKHGFGDKS